MANYILINNNSSDRESIFNLLKAQLFNGKEVSEYSSSKTYNKGDKVYIVNIDGTVTVYTAKEDSITGVFNETKWTAGVIGVNTNSGILVSDTKPSDDSIKMWIKPVSRGEHTLPAGTVSEYINYRMNFNSSNIPTADDIESAVATMSVGDIGIDLENTTDTTADIDSEFANAGNINIEDQGDISVGDDIYTEQADVWVDTNLSDS